MTSGLVPGEVLTVRAGEARLDRNALWLVVSFHRRGWTNDSGVPHEATMVVLDSGGLFIRRVSTDSHGDPAGQWLGRLVT